MTPQSRIRVISDRINSSSGLIILSVVLAFLAFFAVVYYSPVALKREITIQNTLFPIAMGLLGSSVFILYNLIEPLAKRYSLQRNRPKSYVRLFLGPIAGWLSYSMLLDNAPAKGFIWIPFLAGFSSDLLIGIINQIVIALKITLGIEDKRDLALRLEANEKEAIPAANGTQSASARGSKRRDLSPT
ncbi:MAG TPA: hypothetical protein VJ842_11445 [Pyrinomonadaceae bacterium]|nr:hypothetical protein [Pyrinomonadaceae bacterium]